MHQIRREKRTTISEVIVRGKRIKQNGNWFDFNFSVESSSFKKLKGGGGLNYKSVAKEI